MCHICTIHEAYIRGAKWHYSNTPNGKTRRCHVATQRSTMWHIKKMPRGASTQRHVACPQGSTWTCHVGDTWMTPHKLVTRHLIIN